VLVTGGTGCIGSTLMTQLAARRPGRLVSVSRGVTRGWSRHEGAEYRRADVRDRAAMDELMREIRPDLVFHVAAQRDPGLAEVEVHRTVSTNVLGTRTVLSAVAAAAAGARQAVCALRSRWRWTTGPWDALGYRAAPRRARSRRSS
jgi:FlaA1/EpsC-like NDP-sugar epimerase